MTNLDAKRDAVPLHSRQNVARRIRVFGTVYWHEKRFDSNADFLVDVPRGYDLCCNLDTVTATQQAVAIHGWQGTDQRFTALFCMRESAVQI